MKPYLLFAIATGAACLLSAGQPPNVILLMGDDHAWDEVAYNGHPHLQTPVLDEMAATGLRMDRFYSGASTCSPTRGSFLTGRNPNRFGTFAPNWSMRPEEYTIGHLMQQAGYRTGHFGKWHVGPVKKSSPTSPGAMGFDEWLSHDNFFELDPVLVRNGGEPKKYPGESSEIIIDETIRFIEDSGKKDKPFMAVVWFGSPHEPYQALPEDMALYENLPRKYANMEVSLTSNETGQKTTRPLRDVLQERYSEITAMDRAIGNLRDYLKQSGLRENTIVWYCGDNGIPSSGDATNPFRGMKGDVYEGGIRVPCVIEWPATINKHFASKTNTVTSDILPTLAQLTGQQLSGRPIDGISLVPLFKGNMPKRPSPIFFWDYDTNAETSVEREPYIDLVLQEGTTPLVKMMDGKYTRSFRNFHHPEIRKTDFNGPRAVLDNRYKLVIDGGKDTGVELFDIRKDPNETTNLAKEKPAIVKKFKRQLKDWQDSVLYSLTGKDYEEDWKLLWDGRTTNGWRAIYQDEFPTSGWIVENGELICLGEELLDEKRGGAIITNKKYGSFELSFEFKIQEGANSGIKYFIDESLKARMGHGLGLEYAILDDNNFPYPDKDAKRTCGSLYDLVKAKPGATRPVGEWNKGRLVVRGNQIEHWLNGRKVVEIEKGSPQYYDLVSKSKYKNIKGWGEFPKGHILIQDEGPRTAFRNIRIRELDSCCGNSSNHSVLFNGKNLDGWVIENGGQFSVRNGNILVNRGVGWLRSVDTYGDFTLTLEFRFLEKGANSGVFVRTMAESKDDENGWPSNGYQVQCRDTTEGKIPLGCIIPYGGPESENVTDVEAIKRAYRPTGEWNRFVIHCEDDLLTVILNGIVVTRSTGMGNSPGHIGIQAEKGLMDYRRIEIVRH